MGHALVRFEDNAAAALFVEDAAHFANSIVNNADQDTLPPAKDGRTGADICFVAKADGSTVSLSGIAHFLKIRLAPSGALHFSVHQEFAQNGAMRSLVVPAHRFASAQADFEL